MIGLVGFLLYFILLLFYSILFFGVLEQGSIIVETGCGHVGIRSTILSGFLYLYTFP